MSSKTGRTVKDEEEAEALTAAKKEAGIPKSEDVAGETKIQGEAWSPGAVNPKTTKNFTPVEKEAKAVNVKTMCNQCGKDLGDAKTLAIHVETVHAPDRR